MLLVYGPFWFSPPNLAELLQRLIYLEGWWGLCRPSVISLSRGCGIIAAPQHPLFPQSGGWNRSLPFFELGASGTVSNQVQLA